MVVVFILQAPSTGDDFRDSAFAVSNNVNVGCVEVVRAVVGLVGHIAGHGYGCVIGAVALRVDGDVVGLGEGRLNRIHNYQRTICNVEGYRIIVGVVVREFALQFHGVGANSRFSNDGVGGGTEGEVALCIDVGVVFNGNVIAVYGMVIAVAVEACRMTYNGNGGSGGNNLNPAVGGVACADVGVVVFQYVGEGVVLIHVVGIVHIGHTGKGRGDGQLVAGDRHGEYQAFRTIVCSHFIAIEGNGVNLFLVQLSVVNNLFGCGCEGDRLRHTLDGEGAVLEGNVVVALVFIARNGDDIVAQVFTCFTTDVVSDQAFVVSADETCHSNCQRRIGSAVPLGLVVSSYRQFGSGDFLITVCYIEGNIINRVVVGKRCGSEAHVGLAVGIAVLYHVGTGSAGCASKGEIGLGVSAVAD